MKKKIIELTFKDSGLVYMLVSERSEELEDFLDTFHDTSCFRADDCVRWIGDHDVYVNIYLDEKGSIKTDLEKKMLTRELKRLGKYYSLEEMRKDFRKNMLEAYKGLT